MAQRIMSEAAGQVLAGEIKSNTSGLASLTENYEVYSTSERKCGTWIDGRTVYRKTYNLGTMPDNGRKEVQLGVSNVDMVIEYHGVMISERRSFSVPWLMNQNDSQFIVSNEKIIIITDGDKSMYSSYLTVKYIKTT